MRIYKKEFNRIKKTKSLIKSKFPYLGVNKKQEIIRLLYEISKKENLSPKTLIQDFKSKDFDIIKEVLLKRRYPYSYLHNEMPRPYLPKLRLETNSILNLEKTTFYPKRLFIEKTAWRSSLVGRFREVFPDADTVEIKSLKDYLKHNRRFTIPNYNKRSETVFITNENYDFFKKCPCTKNATGCNYHIFNLSFGCLFECTYCYLQEYTNSPGLIFPANIDKFLQIFPTYKKRGMRIGTGEFSDSLMLDDVTEYSLPIIKFFKKHKGILFEFKTKSTNINNLLKINHAGNIIVAWSLNPQRIINENEFFAPTLKERLIAAKRCIDAGYKLALHFDPVIYFNGWQKEYKKVIDLLFDAIKPKDISWISLGTLRFNPKVKQIIEVRFPENKILDEELVIGFDNKLRYPYGIRHEIYGWILKLLSKYSKRIPIYLCMEERSMWNNFKGYLSLPFIL